MFLRVFALLLLVAGPLSAATLPEHRPLRLLIVSDEVNPHGLPPEALTQPGELSAALLGPATGLELESVLEIPTNSIELATFELERAPTDPAAIDVLIYFAHRQPNDGNDDALRQQAFTDAVQAFLERGGGLVAFHHGLYATTGKEGMQFLMGAAAFGNVVWDTTTGQNVIATAPHHFVACNGVSYDGTRTYEDLARAIPQDAYPFFNNTPDERYPQFEFMNSTEEIEILFGSDYDGASHLLGYTHRRGGWQGIVVAYQPGEHQPGALDPLGPDFQILVNAILYAGHRVPRDGISLEVAPGPVAGDVTLSWEACAGSFVLFRSNDPALVGQPPTAITTTPTTSVDDTPPAGGVVFYRVRRDGLNAGR